MKDRGSWYSRVVKDQNYTKGLLKEDYFSRKLKRTVSVSLNRKQSKINFCRFIKETWRLRFLGLIRMKRRAGLFFRSLKIKMVKKKDPNLKFNKVI